MTHLSEGLLNEYLDGALDAQTHRAAEIHLAGCPACRAQLDELRHVFGLLSALPDEPLTADLSVAVWEHEMPAWQSAKRRLGRILAAQGGLALILLVLAWPRLQPTLGTLGAGMLAAWSSWLFRQAAALDLGAWLILLAGYMAPAAGIWQASTAAISGPASAWGVVLTCAFAAWWAGNRLLLRNGHSSVGHGGSHE